MTTIRQGSLKPIEQLLAGPLALYLYAFERYLGDRTYAAATRPGFIL